MTVYKYFVRAAWRYRWTAIIYLVIFLSLSLINLTQTDPTQEVFRATRPTIDIINQSESEAAAHLDEYLNQNATVKKVADNIQDAREAVFLDKADAIIVIPKDFEQRFNQAEAAVDIVFDFKNMKGQAISSKLQKYLMLLEATEQNGAYDYDRVIRAMQKEVTVELISKKGDGISNDRLKRWFNSYYNFAGYIIMAIYIGVIGIVMSDFQDENVMKRVDSSAKSTVSIQLQTYFGQFSVAMGMSAFLVLASIVLHRENLGNVHWGKHVINLIVFSFVALGMTFLINNLTNNRNVKSALSTVLSLGLSFISGVMIDQSFLSSTTLRIAKFFPMYYFVKLNNSISAGLRETLIYLGIQMLFAIAFLVLGLYFAKQKRAAQ